MPHTSPKSTRALTGILCALIVSLPAAQIQWQPSEDMYQGTTSENFVSTLGTSLLAVNPSEADNGTITLNGVPFLSAQLTDLHSGISANGVTLSMSTGIADLAGPGTFGDGDFDGNADIANVIAGAAYGNGTITFSGLSPGKSYAIQVMTNDARNGRSNAFKLNLSDGVNNVATSMTNGTAGQADLDNRDSVTGEGVASGDAIIGTFIADSSTQAFQITGQDNGNPSAGRSQINAIQIREIPRIYEAEDFTAMSGVVIETDKGASSDSIGYIDNGDYADYLVEVPAPGTYRFTFNAASNGSGGTLDIVASGNTIGTATIPDINSWTNWQPFTTNATFTTAGSQTIRLNFVGPEGEALYNIDSFTFEEIQPTQVLVGNDPLQTMRYGMDYERLWYWTGGLSESERRQIAQWSVVDNDIDFVRVAINSEYELTENTYDLRAYTRRIIPVMEKMQEANPDIKFFASPRPLHEAYDDEITDERGDLVDANVAWQPYPIWITGSSSLSSKDFDLDVEKCAQYYIRYLRLMKSYGFKISYMDLTNEWQSNDGQGNRLTQANARDLTEYIKDYVNNGPPSPDPTDPTGFYSDFPALTPDDLPLFIAPSSWNFQQGASWINNLDTTRRRNAIDIAASHNTDKTGTAQEFADAVIDTLGPDVEIWNTELHGWKSTSNANEVLTFSFMMEGINAGFSGLSGWLAIGTTNQGHTYILNPSGTPRRNVKYFIFNKLTNTSHRGQALEIDTPDELSHTTALIKDNLLTVWAINPGSDPVDIELNLGAWTSTNQNIIRTRWNTGLDVEGEVSTYLSSDPSFVTANIPGESLCCFEIQLDPAGGPVTRFEAEAFDAQFGTDTETTSDADGDINVSRIGNGDWLRFDNVTLAENASALFRVARPSDRPSPSIEIRSGSPTGPLFGTADVPLTGGWQNWELIETRLTNAAGTYDLYILFVGDDLTTTRDMMNLNWVAFSLTTPTFEEITPENLLFQTTSITGTGSSSQTITFNVPSPGLGQSYQLQYSNILREGTWFNLGQPQIGNQAPLTFEAPAPSSLGKRFYRITVSLPQ
ncbi:carbohydrate-binding protein [bacterium]|nr:carbohydrate-binding protein [bacterium]